MVVTGACGECDGAMGHGGGIGLRTQDSGARSLPARSLLCAHCSHLPSPDGRDSSVILPFRPRNSDNREGFECHLASTIASAPATVCHQPLSHSYGVSTRGSLVFHVLPSMFCARCMYLVQVPTIGLPECGLPFGTDYNASKPSKGVRYVSYLGHCLP